MATIYHIVDVDECPQKRLAEEYRQLYIGAWKEYMMEFDVKNKLSDEQLDVLSWAGLMQTDEFGDLFKDQKDFTTWYNRMRAILNGKEKWEENKKQ
ncbi:hypothetical protein [Chitinophaga pinensis]|uniref:Uncharacterized protein n=1 Tax=Chitinophaga pinensis TaxID=79329 RepID=A0A5C6LZT6_9BACT|nr:hypothetical protein [Chitinophaga pinensis]TWW02207.1 hypothetical protein FEF09_03420 [Chitinophaga pinensis]